MALAATVSAAASILVSWVLVAAEVITQWERFLLESLANYCSAFLTYFLADFLAKDPRDSSEEEDWLF